MAPFEESPPEDLWVVYVDTLPSPTWFLMDGIMARVFTDSPLMQDWLASHGYSFFCDNCYLDALGRKNTRQLYRRNPHVQ